MTPADRPFDGLVLPEGLVATDPPYLVFHQWLLVAGASAIGAFVALTSGAAAFVVTHDSTLLSVVVLALFVGTTLYCGARAWRLSRELVAVQHPGDPATGTWVGSFRAARAALPAGDRAQRVPALRAALEERVRGPHEVGWFVTETLTKLGLLGTVLGFLIMMTALLGSSQLELSAMQAILRDMAGGMGVKIIATIVGLLCNIVLALQWLLLDRAADKILSGVSLDAG